MPKIWRLSDGYSQCRNSMALFSGGVRLHLDIVSVCVCVWDGGQTSPGSWKTSSLTIVRQKQGQDSGGGCGGKRGQCPSDSRKEDDRVPEPLKEVIFSTTVGSLPQVRVVVQVIRQWGWGRSEASRSPGLGFCWKTHPRMIKCTRYFHITPRFCFNV